MIDGFTRRRSLPHLSTRFAVEIRGLLGGDSGHQPVLSAILSSSCYSMRYSATRIPIILCVTTKGCRRSTLNWSKQPLIASATIPFDALPMLVPRFVQERFLADYSTDFGLWIRLNHVMRRVGLPPLPESVVSWLTTARRRVQADANGLLTEPTNTELTT